ncbi:MAG: hypothetical protein AAFV80_23755 [Bacteroidota bacterium]
MLRNKLQDARVDALASVHIKYAEIQRDFDAFNVQYAKYSDDFEDMYAFLKEVGVDAKQWQSKYGDMNVETVDKMNQLLQQIQERVQAIQLIEVKSQELDQLIQQFDSNHDLATRRQILDNYEQDFELLTALTQ